MWVVNITKMSAPTEVSYGPFFNRSDVDHFIQNYPEKWITCQSVIMVSPYDVPLLDWADNE